MSALTDKQTLARYLRQQARVWTTDADRLTRSSEIIPDRERYADIYRRVAQELLDSADRMEVQTIQNLAVTASRRLADLITDYTARVIQAVHGSGQQGQNTSVEAEVYRTAHRVLRDLHAEIFGTRYEVTDHGYQERLP